MKNFQKFEEWLKQNKAYYPKIEFFIFEKEGRGLIAKEDIEPEEDMCILPLKMLITEYTVRESEIGKLIIQSNILSFIKEPWPFIYIFMIHEKFKKSESFWYPYFEILPEKILTPLSFSNDLLEELKGSNLYEGVIQVL